MKQDLVQVLTGVQPMRLSRNRLTVSKGLCEHVGFRHVIVRKNRRQPYLLSWIH